MFSSPVQKLPSISRFPGRLSAGERPSLSNVVMYSSFSLPFTFLIFLFLQCKNLLYHNKFSPICQAPTKRKIVPVKPGLRHLLIQKLSTNRVTTRACLKNHSCHLHAPLRVIFVPNSSYIARYAPSFGANLPQIGTHTCQKAFSNTL